MIRLSIVLILLVGLASSGFAQDWRAELSEDLVTVRGGKMVYEEYGLIKIQLPGYEPQQYQVKIYAEAPAGGLLSRDMFVSLTTMMFTVAFQQIFAQGYDVTAGAFLDGYDFTDLESPIGTPDYELNLFMTNEGMQFEVVDTSSGQRSRQTMTWAEVFGS